MSGPHLAQKAGLLHRLLVLLGGQGQALQQLPVGLPQLRHLHVY